jgi:hypothetical protein
MIYFQCEHTEKHWGENHRCGGDSAYIITFYTIYTNMLTKHYCERHANEFIKIAEEKGYKITDMRNVK